MVQLFARLFGRKAPAPSPVFELTDEQLATLYSLDLDGQGMVSFTGVLKQVFGLKRHKDSIGRYLEYSTGARLALASDVHGHRINRDDVAPFFQAVFAKYPYFEELAQKSLSRSATV